MIVHPYIELTSFQKEALIGSMLGDGHLSKRFKNACLSISRTIKDKDYLEYESNVFKNLLTPSGIIYSAHIDKRYNKKYEVYKFSTISNESLTEIHSIWYKNKVKVIPENLKLSSISIAHWLADDGHITYNKLPYRFQLDISTHSFTEDENHYLSKLLNERYNEEFSVKKSKSKYFFIRAYDSACRVLFSDIDSYFKMNRKRIWDNPESRFYNNRPERQRALKQDLLDRKEIIKNFIANKVPITLFDLAKTLGYAYDKNIDYRCVNKLLKPYDHLIYKDYDRTNNNLITLRFKDEVHENNGKCRS